MEVIESVLSLLGKGIAYFIAALVGFIVIAIVFGKRVESRFDLEAEFNDELGKEFAEFDLKSWRYEKEGGDFQLKATFSWKDPELQAGDHVQVFLEELLILDGIAEKSGKVFLGKQHIKNTPTTAQVGDACRVFLNGKERLNQVMVND